MAIDPTTLMLLAPGSNQLVCVHTSQMNARRTQLWVEAEVVQGITLKWVFTCPRAVRELPCKAACPAGGCTGTTAQNTDLCLSGSVRHPCSFWQELHPLLAEDAGCLHEQAQIHACSSLLPSHRPGVWAGWFLVGGSIKTAQEPVTSIDNEFSTGIISSKPKAATKWDEGHHCPFSSTFSLEYISMVCSVTSTDILLRF